jgi:hypothetical protein
MSLPISEAVILITRNGMGEAEPALQQRLIQTYLKLLDENNLQPAVICFYTEGVRVGIVGGMTDILEAQLRAGKVITL